MKFWIAKTNKVNDGIFNLHSIGEFFLTQVCIENPEKVVIRWG